MASKYCFATFSDSQSLYFRLLQTFQTVSEEVFSETRMQPIASLSNRTGSRGGYPTGPEALRRPYSAAGG